MTYRPRFDILISVKGDTLTRKKEQMMKKETKYVVRDYTMEQQGFSWQFNSDPFDTYEEALEEIETRQCQDRTLGICDEYYIEKVEVA